MELVFATNNTFKFQEILEITGGNINLISLSDLGFNGSLPEDYHSLQANATQKAFFIYKKYGINCFSDDTGLEIEALNNEPGAFSARYAGGQSNFEKNILKVLRKLKGKMNRRARFRTVIALVETGNLTLFEGEISGVITEDPRGNSGFGYDPIFQPDGYEKTFAEMEPAEKNRISHRRIAVENLVKYLNDSGSYYIMS
ncbi:MAG: RdgB/HAM1 family non-canonical purine NTP pyrophosphatase [Bacteroidales bacterium]|nr:RdgB/HAM1 family non-canonical purine NTP pyrophosphatase [Bacteroidales bacterium]